MLRGHAGVLTLGAVALQLAADGAGRASQHTRHDADAVILLLQAGQRHALFGLELAVVFGLAVHLRTLLDGRCCTSVLNPPMIFIKLLGYCFSVEVRIINN